MLKVILFASSVATQAPSALWLCRCSSCFTSCWPVGPMVCQYPAVSLSLHCYAGLRLGVWLPISLKCKCKVLLYLCLYKTYTHTEKLPINSLLPCCFLGILLPCRRHYLHSAEHIILCRLPFSLQYLHWHWFSLCFYLWQETGNGHLRWDLCSHWSCRIPRRCC